MKVTAEFYDLKVTIEKSDDDLTCTDFVEEVIEPLMLGMGYHPENIDYALGKTDVDPTKC